MYHCGDAVVFLLTSTSKTTRLWSWTLHASWEEKPGELRHTFPLSLLIWHQHLNSFKNVLHPVFQYLLWVTVRLTSLSRCLIEVSNWSASLIFFSAHPVDPIANNQVTSPLIKWCTKDLSFRLLWGSLHTSTLSFCQHPWWNIDGCYLQRSLLPFCLLVTVPVLFLCGLFSECPQLHSGRALQMHDDPVISVWLLMLRKAFSTKLSFQGFFFPDI